MDIIEQLKRDEGEVLHAYQDKFGWWTIGVGRLIDQRKGGGISQDEAAYLLKNDVAKVTAQLSQHLPWTSQLDPVRFAVLQNMTFNMGFEHLVGFHNTLTHIQNGQYDLAAEDMVKSKWAEQVGPRAKRLAEQMKTGVWA